MDEGGVRQANFLQKLFDFLALDPHPCPEVIYWAVDSKQLVIAQPERLAKEVLPKLYKHDKIASFGRQLNIYGFSRVFPGRQFKDASGMVLDASVWSLQVGGKARYIAPTFTDPTLHRLSTKAEVLAVKRRAAPKLFRNRRLANGQTVRTKAGPEVERKFRAIKENMAMERRIKHFASAGLGDGRVVGQQQQQQHQQQGQDESTYYQQHQPYSPGDQPGAPHAQMQAQTRMHVVTDQLELDRQHYYAQMGTPVPTQQQQQQLEPHQQQHGMQPPWTARPFSNATFNAREPWRRDSAESMGSSSTMNGYNYDAHHSLSPTYSGAPLGNGNTNLLNSTPTGYGPRMSLEPIAEYGSPPSSLPSGGPTAMSNSFQNVISPLTSLSPLSPPIHGFGNSHIGATGNGPNGPAQPFPASMWQTAQPAQVPTYFAHVPHLTPGPTGTHAPSGKDRMYTSCPASIHSSPTLKPRGFRPMFESGYGEYPVSPHMDRGMYAGGEGVEVPPMTTVQDHGQDQDQERIAAPATANPYAPQPPTSHAQAIFDNGHSNGGSMSGSGTPSPMGLMPFGQYPQVHSHTHTTPVMAHSLTVSPLSRPMAELVPFQQPSPLNTRPPASTQGLSIEIPPQTATFDASMHGIAGQYVSPTATAPVSGIAPPQLGHGTSGPPTANGAASEEYHSRLNTASAPASGESGMLGTAGVMDVDDAIAYRPQGTHRALGHQQQGNTHTQREEHEKKWATTGSIDPKWVSPQGSTWNTPVPTPRETSLVGQLPMYFPSL